MRRRNIALAIGISLLFPVFVHGEIPYPASDIYIGALEGSAWAGLVFVPHPESAFAFRIRIKKGEETADGLDLLYLVSEVGPHSPDGRYARMAFDLNLPFDKEDNTPILKKPSKKSQTLYLEWSRQDDRTVIGRIQVPREAELELIHYNPWQFSGTYQMTADGHVQGDSQNSLNHRYLFWTNREGVASQPSDGSGIALTFASGKRQSIHFVAGVGEDARILRNHIYRYKNAKAIDSFLAEEAKIYDLRRVRIDGRYEGIAEAITNNLFWSTLYQPEKHRFYIPSGRDGIYPQPDGMKEFWTISGWGSFFSALAASVESTKHSADMLKSILETQYPNGNIPSWRGAQGGSPDRSQPPIGAYVAYKLYQKTADLEILRLAYPYLKRWHAFWKAVKPNGQIRRDGNRDGLLEWGSDPELVAVTVPSWEEGATGKQRATWESVQDDLPNWKEAGYSELTGTMTLNCLDLNSLYTLDAWCLAEMAGILGLADDSRRYREEYESMKQLINDLLWNSREGFYFDKHWDGRFSRRKAASSFFPLLARIPEPSRARQLVRQLLDDKQFWGDFVIPTISREDPDFEQQHNWKGTIWAPINYLVFQGLKAYEFDAEASEFASRSAELFMQSWEHFQLCPENFDSRTGEAGEKRFQSWGSLFVLIALEELLDFTPWEGFRFGLLQPEHTASLFRVAIQGRHYDIRVAPSGIRLKEEGREIIKTNGGAVFRRFLYSENEVAFEIMSFVKRRVEIKFLVKGKYQLIIDDTPRQVFDGNSAKIEIPEGNHSILIQLLERKQ